MKPVDTEVLERPTLTAEQAAAIAQSIEGVELIPNLTPSPEVKCTSVNGLPLQVVESKDDVEKYSKFSNIEYKDL